MSSTHSLKAKGKGVCRGKATGLNPRSDFLSWFEMDEIRNQVFENNIPYCVWCHTLVSADHHHHNYFTCDHIVTRKDGGPRDNENLVLSCRFCNHERGDMSVLQYMAYRAYRY